MPHPSELLLQDVRCFQGSQRATLRPITLLVGENSTGKTTLLGCYSALHGMLAARFEEPQIDFSREPFSMGSFRDIVRSRLGRAGKIREFKIGFRVPRPRDRVPPYEVVATFAERGSQPVPTSWRYEFDSGRFLDFRPATDGGTTVAIDGYSTVVDIPFEVANLQYLTSYFSELRGGRYPNLKPISDFIEGILPLAKRFRYHVRRFLFPSWLPLVPVAPLRAKPRRTYDPIREAATPEGAHIPMLLMRIDHAKGQRWKSLREDLVSFGKDAGLFSDIRVKRHGKQISDPFQLQVKVHSGSHANIMDVGYGVSQSLPILVELLNPELNGRSAGRRVTPESLLFLLQQPEVHLHPRGQAELASFFVKSVRNRKNNFIVETHSDYIVDRVRMSVRRKLIGADDVSILYFEPKSNFVQIHNLRLDEDGNILNAPAGYRDFFLRETDMLLGIGE